MSAAPAARGSEVPADELEEVDVCIVMESTYPYLKGGVSAVVHDIVVNNPDTTFGVLHITWDRRSPSTDLYGVPPNVRWIRPVLLSMTEHRDEFSARTRHRTGGRTARLRRSHALFDALEAAVAGDVGPAWQLYDEAVDPSTRTWPLWGLLGSREFMVASRERLPDLDLPLVDSFWLLREFFSLLCAVMGHDAPRAAVYHAHTTGYASLLGAAAARRHGTAFLLTEHNLYVRDTVNTLLGRNMALPLTAADRHERTGDFAGVTPVQRAWMTWWIEMARFTYPSAEVITYLYPLAVAEAAALGAPVERSVVIPNGVGLTEFDDAHRRRKQRQVDLLAEGDHHHWRCVFIARVVPIKGLWDLIDSVRMLVDRGITNFTVDVLGPTDHTPSYYEECVAKMRRLGVEDRFVFQGVVRVREVLADYDLLCLPSYNEGQPIVVLEVMAAGIPTVGTEVGGMAQLIHDPLTDAHGTTWGPCGLLVPAVGVPDAVAMAEGMRRLMSEPETYEEMSLNARHRVEHFFQLGDAMAEYGRLYRRLGRGARAEAGAGAVEARELVIDLREPVAAGGVPAAGAEAGAAVGAAAHAAEDPVVDLRDEVFGRRSAGGVARRAGGLRGRHLRR